MNNRVILRNLWVLAGTAVVFLTAPASAQTILSNETLVITTLVVNKIPATARCNSAGCSANTPMLASIPVTCPAANGQTCTFHIELDAKVAITFPCTTNDCYATGPETSYQFLVDGNAPTPGPVDAKGFYLFGKNVAAVSKQTGQAYFARQSFPASVVSSVTNNTSGNHTIQVNLACSDASKFGGCQATSYWSTMKVEVYEP